MEALLIGITVGFICSVGFLGLGYTLGVHTVSSEEEDRRAQYKNEVLNKMIRDLETMKDMVEEGGTHEESNDKGTTCGCSDCKAGNDTV